jgi:hypothetical protein
VPAGWRLRRLARGAGSAAARWMRRMTRGRAEGPRSVHECTTTSTTCPYIGVSRGSHVGGAARACARRARQHLRQCTIYSASWFSKIKNSPKRQLSRKSPKIVVVDGL